MELLNLERYRNNSGLIGTVELLFLIVPIITINLPNVGISSLFLFLCLPIIYLRREVWFVEKDLKIAFLMLLAWGVFFTATSEIPLRSVKGGYDMLRAAILFPIAMLVSEYLRTWQRGSILSLSAMVLIALNFLYPRGDFHSQVFFFGYHDNPNNAAVNLFLMIMLSLLIHQWRGESSRGYKVAAAVSFLGTLAGIVLFIMTNSRQAWVALLIPPIFYLWVNARISIRYKLAISTVAAISFSCLLIYFNYKGVSLSRREEIWFGLFSLTVSNHLWFGYGLNVVKDVLTEHSIITQTAHNLFLEVFTSSGVLGLLWFLSMLVMMWSAYVRFEYKKSMLFFVGVCGFFGYFIMAMFDLKLSSYRFLGTYAFFLGLIYSQRKQVTLPLAEAHER